TDVARHQPVEAELKEGGYADEGSGRKDEEQFPGRRHIKFAESQRKGQPQAEIENDEVRDRQDGALGIAAEAYQPQGHPAQSLSKRRIVPSRDHASSPTPCSHGMNPIQMPWAPT